MSEKYTTKYKHHILSNKYPTLEPNNIFNAEPVIWKQTIGIIIFYTFVFFIVPKLYTFLPFELACIIYSNVDMLGDILGTAIPQYFQYTYSSGDSLNLFSYISTNIINLTALCGVLLQGTVIINEHGLKQGLTVMVVMLFITYLIPTMIIPYVQNKISDIIYSNWNIKEDKGYRKSVLELLLGFLVAFIFIILEWIVLKNFISISSSQTKVQSIINNIFFSELHKMNITK